MGEIAERAMVNRATFYRHYQDKYDMVNSMFQDAIDQLTCELDFPLKPPAPSDLEYATAIWTAFFTHIDGHSRLYQAMLNSSNCTWFAAKMRNYFAGTMGQHFLLFNPRTLRKQGTAENMPGDMAIASLTNWLISMLYWWLENGKPYTPQQMANWCLTFVSYGFLQAVGITMPQYSSYKNE